MSQRLFAVVRFQVEGLHRWPDATSPVDFLSHPHRHMFHFRVEVEQRHTERDVEYIQLKRNLHAFLGGGGVVNFGPQSCETIAQELLNTLLLHSDCRDRTIRIAVEEDGENGALLEYEPNVGR